MLRILIVNGPNLNLLGTREPHIYGSKTFEHFLAELKHRYGNIDINYFQNNSEGALIDKLQEAREGYDGVIFNGAGYTHTSIALADTIAAIEIPVIEVHISNIYAREAYRQHSYTAAKCRGCITGLGLEGYALAIDWLLRHSGSKTA